MKKILSLSAFTFAETLLTLVVIGVVAAMTIPPLKHHTDEQKFVAYTQKAFAEVSNATARLETKYGEAQFWDSSNLNTVKEYYSSVLDTVPFPNTSWNTSSITANDTGAVTYHFKTNNGFTWSINQVSYDSKNIIGITVDVNGQNDPNVEGIDIHSFYILNDKIEPVSNCTKYVLKINKMPWFNNAMDSCPQS